MCVNAVQQLVSCNSIAVLWTVFIACFVCCMIAGCGHEAGVKSGIRKKIQICHGLNLPNATRLIIQSPYMHKHISKNVSRQIFPNFEISRVGKRCYRYHYHQANRNTSRICRWTCRRPEHERMRVGKLSRAYTIHRSSGTLVP